MNKKVKISLVLILLSALGLVYSAKNNTLYPKLDAQLAKTTVMVTRLDGRSGGSGVILQSSKNGSDILTNMHVCEVVKNGGKLTTDTQSANVSSYQASKVHDLCLIHTTTDLGVSTVVASQPAVPYSEAVVSGHPSLYPTLITRGMFSQRVTIPIMYGVRECTEQEWGSELGLVCLFMGGIPVIKIFEAQVISPTIMPGSSGSAVFNAAGEISGLVFAGAGDLSYGFIVPLEYINNFLNNELQNLEINLPNNELNITEIFKKNSTIKLKELKEICSQTIDNIQLKQVCELVSRSIAL